MSRHTSVTADNDLATVPQEDIYGRSIHCGQSRKTVADREQCPLGRRNQFIARRGIQLDLPPGRKLGVFAWIQHNPIRIEHEGRADPGTSPKAGVCQSQHGTVGLQTAGERKVMDTDPGENCQDKEKFRNKKRR
jgi:hypothetical protein